MFDFSQRVLLLTGANGGIGRGIARLFAEAGAKMVMADIGLQGAEEFARSLDPAGEKIAVVKLDASSTGDVITPSDSARSASAAWIFWSPPRLSTKTICSRR